MVYKYDLVAYEIMEYFIMLQTIFKIYSYNELYELYLRLIKL